ncbi:peptidoglycan-binding domain-containing protein [Alicyclobacillus fructus]|uniref:peptidoglycan-binding domain-containing protein n=1 Tax=Alicyclobacillus fructus TaxID=2816082 RepID=UPI001A8D0EC7|nr:peptidoglycan-binding domain-containing protein [Alicyclobacillus fructus]
MSPDDKKLARLARERKMSRWLTTLSWSVPALSFGGMFTIWHAVAKSPSYSTATSQPSHAVTHTSATHSSSATGHTTVRTTAVTDPVVLQQGDQGNKVVALQQALSALGFFNDAVTGTYGPITAAAVEAFQDAEGLTPTGIVDERTLEALQHAVKAHATTALTSGGSSSGGSSSGGSSSGGSSSGGSSSGGSSSGGSSSSGSSSSGSSSGGSAMPSFPGPVTSAS